MPLTDPFPVIISLSEPYKGSRVRKKQKSGLLSQIGSSESVTLSSIFQFQNYLYGVRMVCT